MKKLELKLIVEIFRKNSNVTDKDLLDSVRRLIVGALMDNEGLSIQIKDVQKLQLRK